MLKEKEGEPMSENIEDSAVEASKLLPLLERISQETTRQNVQLKRQLRAMRWVAFFCACLAAVSVFACVTLLPKVTGLLAQASGILTELQTTAKTVNETVPATLEEVNGLISLSRTGITTALVDVQTALSKLNSLDIESLNQAIEDLAGIVRPLANLLGR